MPLGIRVVAQYPPPNVIGNGQRVPRGGKTPERWSYPPPGHPGKDDEQNGHSEPRHTVVIAFARMSNKGVGRGKRRKKGDSYNGTTQLAVTYVVPTNASSRFVSDVGIVEQHADVDH